MVVVYHQHHPQLNLRQGGALAGERGRRGLLTEDMETLLELHNEAR